MSSGCLPLLTLWPPYLRKMEAPEGFEPSTFGFVDRCSSPG